jgi:hypothetical protein
MDNHIYRRNLLKYPPIKQVFMFRDKRNWKVLHIAVCLIGCYYMKVPSRSGKQHDDIEKIC